MPKKLILKIPMGRPRAAEPVAKFVWQSTLPMYEPIGFVVLTNLVFGLISHNKARLEARHFMSMGWEVLNVFVLRLEQPCGARG